MFPFALFGLAFATGSVGVLAKYAKQCAIHSDGLEDPIDVLAIGAAMLTKQLTNSFSIF